MSEPKPDPLVRVALELVGEAEIEERSPSARQMPAAPLSGRQLKPKRDAKATAKDPILRKLREGWATLKSNCFGLRREMLLQGFLLSFDRDQFDVED